MKHQGIITTWHDDKGFGFITPMDGEKPVFVHVKGVQKGHRRPAKGQVVTYSLGHDKQGRPRARNVVTPRPFPHRLALVATFMLSLAAALSANGRPLALFYCYLLASLLTFAVYATDKAAARKGGQRLRENTLHLLALLGGWPGAWVAQQQLRHKLCKQAFRFTFALTVAFNLSVLAWAFTPQGGESLNALLRLLG
ncbi:DUF1294 domain-containing protein [Gallaecimonas sp. GXIMD4217]|uniref:DUF1294 domain-containing protein n=1 Tax=Gallaecimonas sp. GXIMD4217 TaxID=3131927 RepID=UPI00311ACA03